MLSVQLPIRLPVASAPLPSTLVHGEAPARGRGKMSLAVGGVSLCFCKAIMQKKGRAAAAAAVRVVCQASDEPPSMAQTAMRGPLTATGSGKPLTAEELEACREELEEIKAKYGLLEPERAHMDEEGIKWRYGGKPDYSLTNLLYLKGKTKNHPEGSLELIVENLVKTWEMERSHKTDPDQHRSVDPEKFHISANGWKKFDNKEANRVGNYNVLLAGCPAAVYDAENITWEQSHDKFHDAFAAFPWEVLEVFSGPPCVAFTWRHWGEFTGTYDGNKGSGELVEMFGFGVATVDDQLRLVDVDIFYKPEVFLEVLRGNKTPEELKGAQDLVGAGSVEGCPHLATLQAKDS